MKALVKIAFFVLVFILLVYLVSDFYTKPYDQDESQKTTHSTASNQEVFASAGEHQNLPVRLKIPKIQVNAPIEYVGVAPGGSMAVPSSISNVGWYNLGPMPGQNGSAVIAGHLNGQNGEVGVFAKLDTLKPGDAFFVEDTVGISHTFIVREIKRYDAGYADTVFAQSDGAHLNLITCDGVWDETKNSYTKRLVVFSDLVY